MPDKSIKPELSGGRLFLLLALLQLLPTAWICRDFVFHGRQLLSNETLDMSLPWAEHLESIGWNFRQAFWDPTSFSGIPFMANPATRTFYPPDLALRLLTPASPSALFSWLILLHFWLLGMGGAWWIKKWARSLPASALSGWLLILNGYILSRAGLADAAFLFAAAWMPWILYFLENLRKSRWMPIGLALCGFMEVLAGRPDLAFYFAILAGCLVLWRGVPSLCRIVAGQGLMRALRSVRAREMLLAGLAAIAIALLTAFQTLPAMELQQQTVNRSGQANFEFASTDSLHPALLLASLLPGCYGDPTDFTLGAVMGSPGRFWAEGAGFHEIYFYCGQALFPLFLVGVVAGRTRMKWFWLSVFAMSLLLAMGKHSTVYQFFFDWVPGWNRLRVPPRILILALLAMARLAGEGYGSLLAFCQRQALGLALESRSDRFLAWITQRGALYYIAFWVGIDLFVIAAPSSWLFRGLIVHVAPRDLVVLGASGDEFITEMILSFQRGTLTSSAFAMITGILFLFSGNPSRSLRDTAFAGLPLRPWLPWLIPVFLLLDLGFFHSGFVKGKTEEEIEREFPKDEILDQHKSEFGDGRLLVMAQTMNYEKRMIHPWFFPGRLFHYGVRNVGGYGPFLLSRYVQLFQQIAPTQKTYNNGLLLFLFRLDNIQPEVFNLFQVSSIIAPNAPPKGFPVARMADYRGPEGNISRLFLCRNPNKTPRAFLYPLPFDEKAIPAMDASLGDARIEQADAISLRCIADASQECCLALLDVWYPGWTCRVNGNETEIQKLAGTFKSIALPAGHSEVEFAYEPIHWRLAKWLLVAGLCILLICLLLQASPATPINNLGGQSEKDCLNLGKV